MLWILGWLAAGCSAVAADAPVAEGPQLRLRATSVKPALYVRVFFPQGNGSWGEITRERPAPPSAALAAQATGLLDKPAAGDVTALLTDEPAEPDRIVEEGQTDNHLWLKQGTWSPAVALKDFQGFVTFRVDGLNGRTRKPAAVEAVTLEFEVSLAGKVLKTFTESSPAGGRLTARFSASGPGSPEFLAETGGLLDYARKRADRLEALPWTGQRLPTRYVFLSACSGWGTQSANPEVYLAEYRSMRQLGVNGIFYNTWPGLRELLVKKEGVGREFAKAQGENQNSLFRRYSAQYLLPSFDPANPRPGDGCPSHPAHAGFATNVAAGVEEMMAGLRKEPYEEYWFQTISEIGSFFDQSAERKSHQGVCPYCREAFRTFLKGFGLTPADFGAADWEPIRSTFGYNAKSWAETQKEAGRARAEQEAKQKKEMEENNAQVIDLADEAVVPELEKKAATSVKPAGCPLTDAGWALLRYYSARFNNEASARVFAPLRESLMAQNERKRKALAEGRAESPEAKQPWVYSFALRGNSFLMGGHSLDFFDWYRHADNAFMYETSNRDPRTWEWDSYLCDVGRIHQDKIGTRFSLMIKPSRGAVVQRTLSAAARQVRAIYWYTYGPDWHHPDTFARAPERLDKVSRVAHMLGEAEGALYDAVRGRPAEVAVVRPLTSAVFDNSASWENGKWVFEALTHAHMQTDALDEGYLLSEDLSRYKAIVVSGSHIRRDVAEKLAGWVEAGGTLITTAGGLARDEADRPLEALQPALGLKTRKPVEVWREVIRYGASALADLQPMANPPLEAAAQFKPEGALYKDGFSLAVGREVLELDGGGEVLGRFGDGGVAVVRHVQGKGAAVTIGFYAGLEYASDIMHADFDMPAQLKATKRGVLAAVVEAAGVEPAVRASCPLIETALMRHPKSGAETILLMNWGYKGSALVPQERVTVSWRGAGEPAKVKSLWLGQSFPVTKQGDEWRVELPRVEEGDILLVE
jgi:hypothetical protein